MGKLVGKIIEASATNESYDPERVGLELRTLRLLCGLTQSDMARRLDVQQAAISKIEKGREVYLSTVKRYVEALGASLRVDAVFPADAPFALNVRPAFDAEYGDENQLVLPLLSDEPFRAQRDVVLSIRPQYSEKILQGLKTVELRRRFPVSAPGGTIAYIYSTSPVQAMVGAAAIKDVLKLPLEQIWSEFEDTAYIDREDFSSYFKGLDFGFVLLFDDVKTFLRPVPLSELRERYGFEAPQSFLYATRDLRKALKYAIVSN